MRERVLAKVSSYIFLFGGRLFYVLAYDSMFLLNAMIIFHGVGCIDGFGVGKGWSGVIFRMQNLKSSFGNHAV